MAHLYVAWGSLVLCTGFALIAGGAPERVATASYLLASIATEFVLTRPYDRYINFETAAFLVDLAVYAVFLILVAKANRFWPPWIAAMQGVSLLGYGLGATGWVPFNLTSAILIQMWAYPILVTLLIASTRHRWRVRRYGIDLSWSGHPPREAAAS